MSNKKPRRTALVDADVIVYRSCFSAEYTVYMDPDHTGIAWRHKKLAPEASRDRLISLTVVEAPDKAVDAFRQILLDTIINTGATHSTLFLSPKTTFRHRVAKTLPYKGNRAEKAKPVYYDMIRNMMIEEYGAIEAKDIEADDALGIMQTTMRKRGESSVICSIDKDLKMIPGDHYNLTTAAQEIITPKAASKQFAIQLLTGDMVDNIQGLTRVGIATAEKILKDTEDPKERVTLIQQRYEKQFKEQFQIAKKYTKNLLLLAIHKIQNFKTVLLYKIL